MFQRLPVPESFRPATRYFKWSLSRAIVPRWNIGRLFLAAAYSSSTSRAPSRCRRHFPPLPLPRLPRPCHPPSPATFFFSPVSFFPVPDLFFLRCLTSFHPPFLSLPPHPLLLLHFWRLLFGSRAPALAQEHHDLWLAY